MTRQTACRRVTHESLISEVSVDGYGGVEQSISKYSLIQPSITEYNRV